MSTVPRTYSDRAGELLRATEKGAAARARGEIPVRANPCGGCKVAEAPPGLARCEACSQQEQAEIAEDVRTGKRGA